MFPISDSIKTTRFPYLNIAMIVFTIFVFIQQFLAPNIDVFIAKYALIPSLVNFSDISTLTPFITAIFIHGGLLHIISNMWFLWIFGDNVEVRLGWFFYLFLYFGAGIIGNFLQYILMPHSSIPMLGASGAIAGILGAYYILFPGSKIKTFILFFIFPLIVEIPASLMLGYWFVLQIISGSTSISFLNGGGIAFFAHIGGFVTGALLALLF